MMTEAKTGAEIGPTVFIVEDDAAVRDALQFLLSSVRRPVRAFACAESFLETISSDQTGCLVLDIDLPGISGFELQARLAESQVDLPVILMTGKECQVSRARAEASSAFGYVEKPLDDEILLPLIADAIAQGVADR